MAGFRTIRDDIARNAVEVFATAGIDAFVQRKQGSLDIWAVSIEAGSLTGVSHDDVLRIAQRVGLRLHDVGPDGYTFVAGKQR